MLCNCNNKIPDTVVNVLQSYTRANNASLYVPQLECRQCGNIVAL